MKNSQMTPGIAGGRLPPETYADHFKDLHAPLDKHEAVVAADRCYFCHDAPCITACPTDIDIPLFIRQIATGTPEAAARTILEQNILGGMCARVCPTEELCEQACVREMAEGKPVLIGQLQRYATDTIMDQAHPFVRAAETGKRVAVVGAGPAGLACAHRLAMLGHSVTVYEARKKPGGLNEFGIASYKSTDDFAQAEVEWLFGIGGITIEYGQALGGDLTVGGLADGFDAVFLGVGLGGVRALSVSGSDKDGVRDAVDFISDLRQADDLSALPVGRHVVVIGGGMTAVDAAVQSKLLGAETVTMVYRRGKAAMSASDYEQDLATSKGVRIIYNASPVAVIGNGAARALECAYTDENGAPLDETFRLPADQILRAIGQVMDVASDDLALDGARLAVTGAGRTSSDGIWAGGDCVGVGNDLTVTAVAQGRDAAMDMHGFLTGVAG